MKAARESGFIVICIMQEQVESLFKEYAGVAPDRVEALPLSGSARRYWRLWQGENSCVGVYNEDTRENELFLDFSRHFHGKGLHVPEIYQVAPDRKVYLQQDLGKDMLLDVVERERSGQNLSEHTMELYKKALDELLRFQLEGTVGLDYSNCLPRPEFDARCMYWDLNYFKYCFLKLANVGADENKLEDDFERLVGHLSKVSTESFMFRDFQSRNIMVLDDEVYFIDYQGGRKGALQYDVASLLYDAIVRMPGGQREELLDYYLDRLLEICFPLRAKDPKTSMMIGVRAITKNGFTACQISGAIVDVSTKSRAKRDNDVPFWWNENQKKMAIPNTANKAYIRCLISLAIAAFSSSVYSTTTFSSFLPGVGNIFFVAMNITKEISMATTEAMNE